jgi:hypothetical protein
MLSMLEQCLITGRQDKERGKPLLDDAVLADIEAFITEWGPQVRAVDIKAAGRSKEVRESGSALAELETYVRDAWVVEKRRIARESLPPEVIKYYGLDIESELPRSGTRAQWLQWGTVVIEGDEAAVAAGYEPIANPSAAQIQIKLEAAQKEAEEVAMRDRDLDEAQQVVADSRPRAEALIYEVMDQLRFNLRKLDAPSQRRIMRSYGATFTYAAGEPVDADDQTLSPEPIPGPTPVTP